jgi:hypothetical protein
MKSRARAAVMLALLSSLPVVEASADEARLGGSMSSMRRQYQVALRNDYTFLRTPAQVREFVRKDRLEPLVSNAFLHVNRVSFPYARPEVKLFIERLAEQYYEANGVKLVVTSLTRPLSRQPRNAHRLSVHPAGMAVDLRVPPTRKARAWLESVLLQLEGRGLLDATRERRPPHYHVAVFPDKYSSYAERLMEREAEIAVVNELERDTIAAEFATADPDASLEPSDSSASGHDGGEQGEIVEMALVDSTAPLKAIFSTLGLTGLLITGAGALRYRNRRRGDRPEERD